MPLASYSYPLLGAFWTIFEIFLWVIWIWILIYVFIDIFRSRDLSGFAKALWFIFVLFIPLIGVLVYLIARGGKMHERAAAEAARDGGPDAGRWKIVPRAVRAWALARPHEWGLIFGTPIPGYRAPEATVEPYARIAIAMMRPMAEAYEAGRLAPGTRPASRPVSDALRAAIAPVSDELFDGVPAERVVMAVEAWTTVVGAVSLEVFGHWRNTILDPGAYFEGTLDDVAVALGLSSDG